METRYSQQELIAQAEQEQKAKDQPVTGNDAPSALVEVQALKFIDVRKKELLYVKFTVGIDEYVINVGKETFGKVSYLVNKAIAMANANQ